ncbi:MAG: outer membrane protein assembly factor BamD [Bacteroidetes bacterium]|nr:outer membrane protein assembly factor BamD [Bacteroidota bacterium]
MRLLSIIFISLLFFSSCFLVPKAWRKSGESFAKIQKSTDYDYKLRMAEKYYSKKDYNHAQQLYDDLFRVMKGTDHFEDIYYKFAYCAYYLKDYMNAENLFKGFVEAFPNSPKSEEMDYMRAFCFYKQSPKVELDQTNTTKAIGFMQAFNSMHPGSERVKEANEIIEKCRAKLELKDFQSAELYYNLRFFKAAAMTFNSLMNSYPDSEKSDQYKLFVIKSNYQYAGMSTEEKKLIRYEQVITDCNDFMDRFPESKLKKQAQEYLDLATNTIKALKNEQVKKAS